ncbi:MAG: lysylphosphatidylglycerol synthase domain-containing protein [Pirellulaceae bacterium]
MSFPTETKRLWLSRLILFTKLVVLSLVGWGIYRSLAQARQELSQKPLDWEDIRWRWCLLASVLYFLGLLPMAWYWWRLLWAMGERPSWSTTLRAYFLGHLGKYVPGKAMVVVLRAGAIRGQTSNVWLAATSVMIETLTMMAVGGALAAVLGVVAVADRGPLTVLAVVLAVVTVIPTFPPILRRLVLLRPRSETGQKLSSALAAINWKIVGAGWCAALLTWLLLGLSFYSIVQALPSTTKQPPFTSLWLRSTASTCLAVVAGFLSLLPGGVGVREYLLDEWMTPVLGPVTAIASAVAARIIWLLTELFISSILYIAVPITRSDN